MKSKKGTGLSDYEIEELAGFLEPYIETLSPEIGSVSHKAGTTKNAFVMISGPNEIFCTTSGELSTLLNQDIPQLVKEGLRPGPLKDFLVRQKALGVRFSPSHFRRAYAKAGYTWRWEMVPRAKLPTRGERSLGDVDPDPVHPDEIETTTSTGELQDLVLQVFRSVQYLHERLDEIKGLLARPALPVGAVVGESPAKRHDPRN